MTRDIVLAIEIEAEPKAIYDTVATRDGLASFWTGDVEGDASEGGELTFGFSAAPARLPMRVVRLDAPSAVEWDCPGVFPFWEGTHVAWTISAGGHGAVVVFAHTGFADAVPDAAFGSVAMTWASVVARLKEVVEGGGTPNPALS